MSAPSCYGAALWYAEHLGWALLPIAPGKKIPLTTHGVLDATADIEIIHRWYEEWPDAGVAVGLAASGLAVLDCDPRNGGDESFERLTERIGDLPDTLHALTGGGGRHWFFKAPTWVKKSVLDDGLELLAGNGYAILPPTVHPSGRQYEWELSCRPENVTLAFLPDVLAARGPKTAPPLPEVIAKGSRHSTILSLAGSMRHRGAGETAILAAIREENKARCNPPLDDDELTQIASSVLKYAPGERIPVDHPPTKANGIAKLRDALNAAQMAAARATPGDTPKLLRSIIRDFTYLLPTVDEATPLKMPSRTLAEIAHENPQLPPTVVGGVLRRAQVGLLAGTAGVSKTWLLLQLASAVAARREWIGHACAGANVGVILTETTSPEFWQRQQAILEMLADDDADWHHRMHIVSADAIGSVMPPGQGRRWPITERRVLEETIAWASDKDLVLLDPFAGLHRGNEMDPEVIMAVVDALRSIADKSNAAILGTHHTRKSSPGNGGKLDDPLESVRGRSELVAAVDLVAVLERVGDRRAGCTYRRLVWAKVRGGPEPPPIYLVPTPAGPLVPTTTPDPEAAGTRSAMAAFEVVRCIKYHPEGLSKEQLSAETGICESRIRKLLPELERRGEITSGREGRGKRYYPPVDIDRESKGEDSSSDLPV